MSSRPGLFLPLFAALCTITSIATLVIAQPIALSGPWYAVVAMGVAAAVLMVMAVVQSHKQHARLAEQHRAEQEAAAKARDGAVMQLLDEITRLADGDLTSEFTVSEAITGALADSLNMTVHTLRELVGTIHSTSGKIGTAAQTTVKRSRDMANASDAQAQDLVSATKQVVKAADSLSQVAGAARGLSDNAQTSMVAAKQGGHAVQRMVEGMNTLREQIQETSKRIKRLGESSQEVGDIIEFIEEIAEQTNTLALNASIQAAMAGESGRGFAVVAEQVQQLAERVTAYTKQVETLIKAIQADTQEAITSMERSTTTVVSSAHSAEDAGAKLVQMEALSQNLAGAMSSMADAARVQAESTHQLTTNMTDIREVAMMNSSLAAESAASVDALNELSDRLKQSVSRFVLPKSA